MAAGRRGAGELAVREAMAVLREVTPASLAEALRRVGGPAASSPLDRALRTLEAWFRTLPPDRTQPEMTFNEFARLLRQALRAEDRGAVDLEGGTGRF